LEGKVIEYAASRLVPEHFGEVKQRKEEIVARTMAAVRDRLTKEIAYWDHRAEELKAQELAGKVNARINSGKARQRADDLQARLQKRVQELEQERWLSSLPPVVMGGALVIPQGLLVPIREQEKGEPASAQEREKIARAALNAVVDTERSLGFQPKDVSDAKCGYDVESGIPGTGRLRFIEVKGRAAGAQTVTVTRNEILTGFNKPEDFILALVEVDGERTTARYLRRPFQREPDFAVTSVNYDLSELLARAELPS
jgi:hypothetical protein